MATLSMEETSPPMQTFDIGANLANEQFSDDLAAVLRRAQRDGVYRILATGTNLKASQYVCELAHRYPGFIQATAGVHPHAARFYDEETRDALWHLWHDPAVRAVGECGLDYFRMLSEPRVQREVFEAHLAAASELGKPVFLHCRDAFVDFYAMLRGHADLKGVVHCFTGCAREAEAYLDLGLDLGITGWVTDERRASELRDALRVIPLQRMHLETDAPFLSPRIPGVPLRRRNEPSYLRYVAAEVARLRDVRLDDLLAQTRANGEWLFGPAVTRFEEVLGNALRSPAEEQGSARLVPRHTS